ncbi:hypothetical protein FB451DRAFT_1030930 [Mycena latifolia]|nr:hypothetical protein FB451DRAFT_1030930 [Mycena latifolia]
MRQNAPTGFAVPARNYFPIVSAQFLLSFFPALFVIPVGYLWRTLDWMLRWYQPYVIMSRGKATAEESVLLDYVAIFCALKHDHKVIFWSSLLATATYLFQPLAGSIFQIQTRGETKNTMAQSIQTLGLIPDVAELDGFAAAAGFVQAAVFNHLPDPPFIHGRWSSTETGGWSTAEFVFPTNIGLNGSMTVNTTATLTDSNCSNPSDAPIVDVTAGSIFSTSLDGCSQNITFNPSASDQQYGVTSAPCSDSAALNIALQPLMFWFWNVKADQTPEVRTVFCNPTMELFSVNATADLTTGQLLSIVILETYTADNNLTGAPLNGVPYNAIIFENNPNPFIQARATATRVGVPGAIFRSALQEPDGLQSVFDLPNGFLDLTNTVYTQHLAVAAKSTYFVSENSTLPAVETALVLRLWIDPFPAHILAGLLIVSGFLGIFVQLIHRRQRRHICLAAPPGTIAAAVALTARSGFGHRLSPYDDLPALKKKLEGLRFRLDSRTGAILADADESVGNADSSFHRGDDATVALLGHHNRQPELIQSSSQLAQRAALEAAWAHHGWKEHRQTPYDN